MQVDHIISYSVSLLLYLKAEQLYGIQSLPSMSAAMIRMHLLKQYYCLHSFKMVAK